MTPFYVHWCVFKEWPVDHYSGVISFFSSKVSLQVNSLIVNFNNNIYSVYKISQDRGVDDWQELYVKRFLKNWGTYVFKILCDFKECGRVTKLAR